MANEQIVRHQPVAADKAAFRTVRDLIRHAASSFGAAGLSYGHGTDNAYDEAAALVLWALHLPPTCLDPHLDARLSRAEIDSVIALIVERITTRKPLGYLTGEAWLGGLSFVCDERALVPRSPIVEAMDQSIADWFEISAPHHADWPAVVVDLCTGGGSIAIHAALRFPKASVFALDVDDKALSLCRQNIEQHGLGDQIQVVQSDLLSARAPTPKIDLLLCNPPYVPQASIDALPPEYRAEPGHALLGGDDGLDLIRQILRQAAMHLDNDGLMVLELGHEADTFESAYPELDIYWLETAAGSRMLAGIRAQSLQSLVNSSE